MPCRPCEEELYGGVVMWDNHVELIEVAILAGIKLKNFIQEPSIFFLISLFLRVIPFAWRRVVGVVLLL